MAKIVLNVQLNAKDAKTGLSGLQQQIDKLSLSLKGTKQTVPDFDKLRGKLASLSSSIQSISRNYKKGTFSQITTELSDLQKQLSAAGGMDKASKEYAQALLKIDAELNKLSADFKETRASATNFHGSLKDIVSGFLKFQLAARVVMVPLQAIRQAWQSLNDTLVETEDRIIAIQRVVKENITNGEMAQELYDIAIAYGQTFENVSEIATNFARSGLSWNDTIEATKSAVLALNVAELDATESTEGLLAIMAQFNLSTSDLENIIDKLNKTSDNYLVTTEKILKALQRTGSAAANANLTLDQTVGLITALSASTNRSGENIGTALNSLIQYSKKESALSVFAGLSEDSEKVVNQYRIGAATILDVWRQVGAEIKNLNVEQANMLDAYFNTEDGTALKDALDGELQDFYTEVAGVYDTANTYRKNYFIALLNNIDTVDSAIQGLSDAQGYSAQENEKYLDSYTAKVNSLKAKWQEVANDEQGLLKIKKGLVDFASLLLSATKNAGGLKTILLAVAGATTIIFGPKILLGIKNFVIGLKEAAIAAGSLATGLSVAIGAAGMIAAIAISIVNSVKSAREEAERAAAEARRSAIDTYLDERETAAKFSALYDQYKKATSTDENFYSIEKQIVELLGDKASALSILTQGTKEYSDAVDTLSQKEQDRYEKDLEKARRAAKEGLENAKFSPYKTSLSYSNEQQEKMFWNMDEIVKSVEGEENATIDRNPNGAEVGKHNTFLQSLKDMPTDTIEEKISYYEAAKELSDKYWEEYNRARIYETEEYADAVYMYWKTLDDAVVEYGQYVDEYKKVMSDVEAYTQSTSNYTGKIVNNLSQISDKQKGIASALKEYRSEQEKSEKLAEKQLAIEEAKEKSLKAQQDLAAAYNERNVAVYNKETGTFELQASKKSISSAQDNLTKAEENLAKVQEALEEYVKDQAWDDVIAELSAGNATNDSILAIVAKWAEYSTDKAFGDEILSILGENAGFKIKSSKQLAQEAKAQEMESALKAIGSIAATGAGVGVLVGLISKLAKGKLFDDGGVLTGLGGIKATSRPETVNDPDLTAKILSPSSNEQFSRYVRDMNLLFGASESYARNPMINNIAGNTTNNNGNTYVINGVSITGEQAERYTIAEIFDAMPIAR